MSRLTKFAFDEIIKCFANEPSPTKRRTVFNGICKAFDVDPEEGEEQLRFFEKKNPLLPAYSILKGKKINKISVQYFVKPFLDQYFPNQTLRNWKSNWTFYNGKYYEIIKSKEVLKKISQFCSSTLILNNVSRKIFGQELLAELESRTEIEIDKDVEPNTWISQEDQDLYGNALIFENGILPLNHVLELSYELISHTPRLFNFYCLEFDYDKNAKLGKNSKNFLDSTYCDDKKQLIKEWIGCHLFAPIKGLNPEKFVLLYGEGANGKSVQTTIMRSLFGVSNISSVGLVNFNEERSFQLVSMIGKIANICTDLSDCSKISEGILKRIVSREGITMEKKHGDAFSCILTALLTFSTNIFPRFSDKSSALTRRMIFISFNNQILDETKQNKNFVNDEFWKSSGELPGLMNWAIEGFSTVYINKHITIPKVVKDEQYEFFRFMNPVREFLEENYEASSGSRAEHNLMYRHYQNWCKDNGVHPCNKGNFSREIKRAFPKVTKSSGPLKSAFSDENSYMWANLTQRQWDTTETTN